MRRIVQKLLFLPVFALTACIHTNTTDEHAHYGYYGDIAPENWCGLSQENALCCGGEEQSPVDINLENVFYSPQVLPFHFNYPPTAIDIVHNGHTIQANLPEGAATLTRNGKTYSLLQFHFHTPSEHTIREKHEPIEMHLVHRANDDGALLVIGVFIVQGRPNPSLEKIWDVLPKEEDEIQHLDKFDIATLLPKNFNYYSYSGSLTTPPCTEGIAWFVLKTPLTLDAPNIAQFQKLFRGTHFPNGNARPPQALGGRTITTNVKPYKVIAP